MLEFLKLRTEKAFPAPPALPPSTKRIDKQRYGAWVVRKARAGASGKLAECVSSAPRRYRIRRHSASPISSCNIWQMGKRNAKHCFMCFALLFKKRKKHMTHFFFAAPVVWSLINHRSAGRVLASFQKTRENNIEKTSSFIYWSSLKENHTAQVLLNPISQQRYRSLWG